MKRAGWRFWDENHSRQAQHLPPAWSVRPHDLDPGWPRTSGRRRRRRSTTVGRPGGAPGGHLARQRPQTPSLRRDDIEGGSGDPRATWIRARSALHRATTRRRWDPGGCARPTPENVAFIREAVAAGVSLIDTAHVYTGGESEDTIGAALSSPPAGCLVATSRRAAEVRRSSRDSPGSALASRTPPGW